MTLKSLLSVAVVAAVVSGSALAQPGDPLIGTWKLNVEKSTGTSFKSGTTNIEAAVVHKHLREWSQFTGIIKTTYEVPKPL